MSTQEMNTDLLYAGASNEQLRSALLERDDQLRTSIQENAQLKARMEELEGEVELVNQFRESLRKKFNTKSDTLSEAMAHIESLRMRLTHYESALKEAKVIIHEGAASDSYVEQSFRSKCSNALATINKVLGGEG